MRWREALEFTSWEGYVKEPPEVWRVEAERVGRDAEIGGDYPNDYSI